jgi:hypothetical protein
MEEVLERNGVHAGNVTRNSMREVFGEMIKKVVLLRWHTLLIPDGENHKLLNVSEFRRLMNHFELFQN